MILGIELMEHVHDGNSCEKFVVFPSFRMPLWEDFELGSICIGR
jgi:hypothetical protein